MSTRVSIFAAVVTLLVTASAASAYRTPRASERQQIVKAIHGYLVAQDCQANGTCHPQIRAIRVSLANQTYATAGIYIASIGGATALLHKTYGTWRVTDFGSADIGCSGKAPKAVRVDLELTCPGGK